MIDDIKNRKSSAPVALAYFYCRRNNSEHDRQAPEAILRAIVKQLAQPKAGSPLQTTVVNEYKRRGEDGFSEGLLQLETSQDIILALSRVYPETIIVLDALDECDPQKRDKLIESLQVIKEESNNLVKIFISSRDDDDIVYQLLDTASDVRIRASDNSADIELFVRTEVSECIRRGKLLPRQELGHTFRLQIEDALIARADGM